MARHRSAGTTARRTGTHTAGGSRASRRTQPSRTTAVLGVAAAAAVVAGSVLVTAPAGAADGAASPLAGASGFTLVSFEDVALGNHELEGSVAAGGAVRNISTQPFNLVHQAAGNADYDLPTLDGVPVRLVAGSYDLAGSTSMIRVSSGGARDAGDEGRVRLGSTTGQAVQARGSGVCVQPSGRNDCDPGAKVLEQSAYRQSVGETTDADAFEALVTASDRADLESWNAAISAGDVAGAVTTTFGGTGEHRTLTLVEGVPNIVKVNPGELPSGFWDVAFTGGVLPSATTPVLLDVVATDGDTLNLPVRFIGWDAQGQTNDRYAPYLLWNVDQADGATLHLTGGDIVPGSWLAPRGTLVTSPGSKTLLEGQVVARNLVLRHDGEVHHYAFEAELALAPTEGPTDEPTDNPTDEPTDEPTDNPTDEPTDEPTDNPTDEPTDEPTDNPTDEPTDEPTDNATDEPMDEPTDDPTDEPTDHPTGGGSGSAGQPTDPAVGPTGTDDGTDGGTDGQVDGTPGDQAGDGSPDGSATDDAAQDAATQDEAALATTGSDVAPVALVGLGAVALGGALVATRRHRARGRA